MIDLLLTPIEAVGAEPIRPDVWSPARVGSSVSCAEEAE
jgi:hypothetical protein